MQKKIALAAGFIVVSAIGGASFFVAGDRSAPSVRVTEVRSSGMSPFLELRPAQGLGGADRGVDTKQVTLVAVGDIMLSRSVAKTIKEKNDINFPFLRMRDYVRSADIAFANLETPLTPGRDIKPHEMMFRSDPAEAVAIKDAGFSVLSLANNHVPNFGEQGILNTVRILDDAGIAHAGAGADDAAALAPAIIEKNGTRFAFLAFNDTDVVPSSYGAGPHHAGTAFMDIVKMTAAVQAARQQADVVIVSMHSGIEYTYGPDRSQTRFAHAAIDAGADLVLGGHPHVVQPVELYKGKLIFYCLGNFVFDQMWSEPTKEGMAIKITFDGDAVHDVELVPVYIEQFAQPHPATGKAAADALGRLKLDAAEQPFFHWNQEPALDDAMRNQ